LEILAILLSDIEAMSADFGTGIHLMGEINRFQRLTGAIEFKFDDSTSLNIPSGPSFWNMGSFGCLWRKKYGRCPTTFMAIVEIAFVA